MTPRTRYIPLVVGIGSLVLGLLCLGSGNVVLGAAAGVLGGLAALLALVALREFAETADRLLASRLQVQELEDVVADQVQARMSAEASVASLGEQLQRAERHPAVTVEVDDAPGAPPAVGEGTILDPETGLFNEDYFSVSVHTRVASARRHLRPISLVLIDVMEALDSPDERPADPELVTESIRATLRDSDTPCRLGDGMFALVLEDTPENGAIWTIERIRRHLASSHERITVWAGVACYPAHAFDRDRLVDQARQALGAARDWRQDRIEVAIAE